MRRFLFLSFIAVVFSLFPSCDKNRDIVARGYDKVTLSVHADFVNGESVSSWRYFNAKFVLFDSLAHALYEFPITTRSSSFDYKITLSHFPCSLSAGFIFTPTDSAIFPQGCEQMDFFFLPSVSSHFYNEGVEVSANSLAFSLDSVAVWGRRFDSFAEYADFFRRLSYPYSCLSVVL